ncbi:hypothetical protein C7U92_08965 [Bradyrhizobium sp. WBOS7]|uniref:Uncharacterized protein n=2 Tax=Nitrobacteraceae TaxID=41294 RepID=A0AAE9NH79_9BRAD|nr:hypothetical protein [Bradyrhizobium sp. WBOS2]MDD1570244.1 hypothetical protein [Bradyrhizobium sp. WBOS1]MDD1576864.1 hypothetical protein [Bradyrhizobium sp. WBOS7]MDD1599175.1 hypothetical protein [Bradyrhizobium sp. WBOS16]UUO39117.1 hypothetical protein DCK84_19980 [Bradyrhizobium sp. WBOS01]UUO45308.1 hypothetical protein DCM75_20735 [Bradyrhizobium sp. WBOS02]UUO57402.1 hypothetical protein DCM79_14770 [Bradyrhizobium sp. WBOS07]UUO69820.1 hypothetical protein DCM83_24880 [Bradyrh
MARQGRFIMPIQSKALPRSSLLRRAIRSFTASSESGAETAHPLLVISALVLFTLFAIVEIDLHSAQLQAIGLLGHGTGIDPVFLGP